MTSRDFKEKVTSPPSFITLCWAPFNYDVTNV